MHKLKSKIPKIFYSDKTGNKHNICIMCDDMLPEYENGYIIEKAFKKNLKSGEFEVIFEEVKLLITLQRACYET